jgi:GT2 family glycosyltransferase
LQRGVEGKFEVVVTDDGSIDETSRVVDEFARGVPFHVGFTTHPHTTFRLARCRNEGVRASSAPYLLFLDGDCVLPPDHVRMHLARRRNGLVMAGDCCRLERDASEQVTSDAIRAGHFEHLSPPGELRRIKKLDRSSRFYRLIRHPTKPKLIGNNVGIWRADYERVNGYDENFEGWGCEDDDLRWRLRRAGIAIESILRWTHTYHLWHANDSTAPATWKQGANVGYLLRKGRLTRCAQGLVQRAFSDLRVQVIGQPERPLALEPALARCMAAPRAGQAEVEILFLPGRGRFSGRAECNLAVLLDAQAASSRAAQAADLVIHWGPPLAARLSAGPLYERCAVALGAAA